MKIVVLGYGFELRGDDAAGREVARAITAEQMSGVTVVEARQLTPELAESLATADRVIFVDACLQTDAEPVCIRPVNPDAMRTDFTHLGGPESLLRLARLTHGKTPDAWLVTVAGTDFSVKEGLSPSCQERCRLAAAKVREIVVRSQSDLPIVSD